MPVAIRIPLIAATGRDAGSGNIHHASPRNNFLNHDLSSGRCPVMGVLKLPCTGINDGRGDPGISRLQGDRSRYRKTWCDQMFMNKYVDLEIVP
jgi:hypothetical protein